MGNLNTMDAIVVLTQFLITLIELGNIRSTRSSMKVSLGDPMWQLSPGIREQFKAICIENCLIPYLFKPAPMCDVNP